MPWDLVFFPFPSRPGPTETGATREVAGGKKGKDYDNMEKKGKKERKKIKQGPNRKACTASDPAVPAQNCYSTP